MQYYSSDCLGTFERKKEVDITRANEQEALCVSDHLNEAAGTRIAFSTLGGRPSAEDFEHSPVLQDWVTATDIRYELFNEILGQIILLGHQN